MSAEDCREHIDRSEALGYETFTIGGEVEISRNRFKVNRPELLKDGLGPEVATKWDGDGHVARPQLQNWLDCIRTRNTPVEVGHRTVTICHLPILPAS